MKDTSTMKDQENVDAAMATTANSVSSVQGSCTTSESTIATPGFLTAIVEGNVDVVSKMLQSSVESRRKCLSMRDEDGYPALAIASRHGHADIVQLLLELDDEDVNVNEEVLPTNDPNLKNEGLQKLLKAINLIGAKTPQVDPLRYTPLLLASKHGHARVVEILLQNGADVNKCTGTTALRTASGHLHEDCVKLLLAHGADVSICQPQTGGTALYSASMVGHVGIATMLLAHGANVNDASWNGQNTCLMMAAFFRHAPMVDLLLKHGADPNRVNVEGVTALWFAARKGNATKEIQESLLAHGAKATPGLLLGSALFSGPSTAWRLWKHRTWRLPTAAATKTTS